MLHSILIKIVFIIKVFLSSFVSLFFGFIFVL
nr:MAG TPA: hypothetical protein [Bacteriophage sp.]